MGSAGGPVRALADPHGMGTAAGRRLRLGLGVSGMEAGRFWDHFVMSVTAYQTAPGALGAGCIETDRDYASVADFVEDFHQLMWDLKLGILDEILFDPQSVLSIAYMVRNARGGRFEFFDLWGDGETEEEQGKHILTTEDQILEMLLEHYQTETWYRTPFRESDYHRSSEVANHGKLIVDFLKTGDILEGEGEDEALDEWIRYRNAGEGLRSGSTSIRNAA